MGATPTYDLPYPEPADPADGPTDIRELAEQVDASLAALAASQGLVGAPIPWLVAAIPSGYLEFAGQAISAAQYPQLAALFGANLPDLRGRTLLGADGGAYPVGGVGGEAVHVLSAAEMPAHAHTVSAHTHAYSHDHQLQTGASVGAGAQAARGTGTVADIGGGGSGQPIKIFSGNTGSASPGTSSAGSGAGHNNLPPYRAVRWITRAA
jgi:microcystin-dependent protein